MVLTPKQVLREHLERMHATAIGQVLPRRITLETMARMHASIHHRYWVSHDHAGTNLGPGDRPPGWRTGEDVVIRSR